MKLGMCNNWENETRLRERGTGDKRKENDRRKMSVREEGKLRERINRILDNQDIENWWFKIWTITHLVSGGGD